MSYAHNINKIMQGYIDTIAEQSMEIKKLKEQAVTFTNLSDMQTELLHKMDADHVSKAELRAWCEYSKRTARHRELLDTEESFNEALNMILEKFCKEEL